MSNSDSEYEDDIETTISSADEYPIGTWIPSIEQYTYKNLPVNYYSKSLKPFAMAIIASRNQGKSALFKFLYKKLLNGKFSMVIIFSNTMLSGQYNYINTKLKYTKYSSEVLENLQLTQDNYYRKHHKYFNTLVIFDDCISANIKNDQSLENIFLMGRHRATSIAFLAQAPTLLRSTWRQNITHLFILRIKGLGKEYIIDNFLLDLVDDDDIADEKPNKFLKKLMKQVFAEKYRALVVEFEKESSAFYNCVSEFKGSV